jgi:hypothetical protein
MPQQLQKNPTAHAVFLRSLGIILLERSTRAASACMLFRYVIKSSIKAATGFLCWTGRINGVLHVFHCTVDIFSGALSRPFLHTSSKQ